MFVQRWKSYPKWINHSENSAPNIRANRADLGQTAPKRAVWSVSTLFANSLSESFDGPCPKKGKSVTENDHSVQVYTVNTVLSYNSFILK